MKRRGISQKRSDAKRGSYNIIYKNAKKMI